MKYIIAVIFLMGLKSISLSQYVRMDELDSYAIHVGSGNYYIHVDAEGEAKTAVNQIIKYARLPKEKIAFDKGKNLPFAGYMVDVEDDRFIYFIYVLRVQEGYDVYALYCSNSYIHFFDYREGKDLYSLIFNPKVNQAKLITQIYGTLQQDKPIRN